MSCREQGPERIEAEGEAGNGIQLNWPEEATAAKIEGLVTNSASLLIAIQSKLTLRGEKTKPHEGKSDLL